MAKPREHFFTRLPSELNYNIQTNSDKKWKEDFILHFKCFCEQGNGEIPSIIITFYQKHITRSQDSLISKGDKVEAPDREYKYHEAIITEVNNNGTYNIKFDNASTRNNVRLEEIHLLESRVKNEETPEGIKITELSTQEDHFENWVNERGRSYREDKNWCNFFWNRNQRQQKYLRQKRTFTGYYLNLLDNQVLRHIIVRNRFYFYYDPNPLLLAPHCVLWSPVFHESSGGWKTTYPIVDYPIEGKLFFNGLVEGFLNTNSTNEQIKEEQTKWKKKYKLVPHYNNNKVPGYVTINSSSKNIDYDRTVNVIEAYMHTRNTNWFINPFRRSNFLGWSFDCSYTKKSLYYLIPEQKSIRAGMYRVPYNYVLEQYYKDAGIPIDTDQGHNIHKIEITPFTPFNIRYNDVGVVWFEPRMSIPDYPIVEIFNNFIDRIEGTDTIDRIRVDDTGVRPKYKWRMKDEQGDWNNDNFNGQLKNRAFVVENHFKRKWNFGKMPTWNTYQGQFEANVDGRRECRAFIEIHLRCTKYGKMPLSKQNFSEPSTYQEKNKINLKF